MERLGVFYSIGFFILGTVFIAFAVLVTHYFTFSLQEISDDATDQRVHTLDESIQQSFRDLFTITKITLRSTNDSFTLIETPSQTNDDNFKENLTQFRDFLQSNYSIQFNVTDITTDLPIFIKPYGIIIQHPQYDSGKIAVMYDQVVFDMFNLTINYDNVIDANSCQPSGTSSNPALNVYVIGTSGESSCDFPGISNFDLYDINSPPNLITSVRLSGKNLNITSFDIGSTTYTLRILNFDVSNESMIVTTKEQVLSYSYPDFGFFKNGTIRLL